MVCELCHSEKIRTDAEKRLLCNRLSRMEGQLRALREMVEGDAYCVDILTQSSAVNAAMSSFSRELLASHVRSCVVEDIRSGRDETVDELLLLLRKMMR